MSLTPAEVRNVSFKKPPMGKRGLDAEEVDAFLDEVERELARLIEENDQLRARVGGGDAGLAAELADLRAQFDRAQRERAAAEQAARAVEAELEQARSQHGDVVGISRMLTMAQRNAEGHVADALREADVLRSEARSKAHELASEARASADALERDARQRHQEAIEGIEAKRTAMLNQIEELKQFSLGYSSRLEEHLKSQLRDVGERGRLAE